MFAYDCMCIDGIKIIWPFCDCSMHSREMIDSFSDLEKTLLFVFMQGAFKPYTEKTLTGHLPCHTGFDDHDQYSKYIVINYHQTLYFSRLNAS